MSSRPIHVDFLRIGEHSQVNVNVPVSFTDEEESPGIKRGGVLNIVRHDLELICDAAEIPEQINISLKGLEIGDSIHISSDRPAQGLEVGDRRPRLHHRDRRRSVGDEVRGRRHRDRGARPKSRPSVTKKPKAAKANEG